MERRDFLKSIAGGTVAVAAALTGCKTATCGKGKGPGCAPCGKACCSCPAMASGKCEGCRSKAADTTKAKCPIRACAAKKGVETCAQCPGFPCAKLKAWAEKSDINKAALKRLEGMRMSPSGQ